MTLADLDCVHNKYCNFQYNVSNFLNFNLLSVTVYNRAANFESKFIATCCYTN